MSRDIFSYLREKGEPPAIPSVSEKQYERIHFVFDHILPFQKKVFDGYDLRFKHRVIKLRDELEHQGYRNHDLNKAIDKEYCDSDKIAFIADGLSLLAETMRTATKRKPQPLPLTENDPKIVPECNWLPVKYTEQLFQERPITLANRGGSDAKDVEIHQIKTDSGEAEFEPIGFIAIGKSIEILPRIYGPNHSQPPFGCSDLVHLMDSEYKL